MGFRSTLITEHNHLPLPPWFVEKYTDYLYINGVDKENSRDEGRAGLPLASKYEFKTYFPTAESLPTDIQQVIRESPEASPSLVMIWLHECGGITRVQIDKDNIIYSEPTGWKKTDGVTHNYCYGCSDLKVTPLKT